MRFLQTCFHLSFFLFNSVILSIFLGVELLGYKVTLHLNFLKTGVTFWGGVTLCDFHRLYILPSFVCTESAVILSSTVFLDIFRLIFHYEVGVLFLFFLRKGSCVLYSQISFKFENICLLL